MRHRYVWIALALAAALALAGCGRKGDLYLPSEDPEQPADTA
ncbi:LPS translocon maturation chaperone LptM [Arhodomonas sp. AD133]